jgi:hypothetical protein
MALQQAGWTMGAGCLCLQLHMRLGHAVQLTCPSVLGNCVLRSQKRTVVSPLPLASCLPSGLNATCKPSHKGTSARGCMLLLLVQARTDSTDSEWPGMEAVHRETGRTLKMACGAHSMHRAPVQRPGPCGISTVCTCGW